MKLLKLILEDDEPVIETIESYLLSNKVGSVVIHGAEGMVKKTSIRFYSGGSYKTREYEEPLVVKAASGQFAQKDRDIRGEIYVSLKKDDIHSISGTLIAGKAHGELEVLLRLLDPNIITK